MPAAYDKRTLEEYYRTDLKSMPCFSRISFVRAWPVGKTLPITSLLAMHGMAGAGRLRHMPLMCVSVSRHACLSLVSPPVSLFLAVLSKTAIFSSLVSSTQFEKLVVLGRTACAIEGRTSFVVVLGIVPDSELVGKISL